MKRLYLALVTAFLLPCNLFAQTITTFAGTGTAGYSGDGGAATAARFSRPTGLAVDSDRNVYVADGPNYRIRMISTAGVVTTIAGTGTAGYSGDGGPATAAKVGGLDTAGSIAPLCIAAHNGNIYIADGANHVVRMIDTAGAITTVAGTGTRGYSGDGGAATAARLRYPQGISFDAIGNLYIADCHNQRIRMVDTAGIITTIAGTGTAGYTGNGGAATAARLRFPFDAQKDDLTGNLYIADMENNVIRVVDSLGVIRTLAGTSAPGHTGDNGPATAATLDRPAVVRFDGMGNVYLSDNHNSYVRRINAAGVISRFAGNGTVGFSGDGGAATAAQMRAPWGLAVDGDEYVYVSDSNNARIRKVSLIRPIAGTYTLCSGSTATLSNATPGGTWASSNEGLATIDIAAGVLHAIHPGNVIITYSTAGGRATKQIIITGPTLSGPHTMLPVCSGDSVLYAATSTTFGTSFAWQRSYVPGIAALAASGTGNIAEVLDNTTSTSKTVTYIYTMTTTGCSNTESVRVTISPIPRLSSDNTPSPVCSGVLFGYAPTSFSTGTTFAWSRAVVPGISNPAGSGTGNIGETLISTDDLPVGVKYVYTMTVGSCDNVDTVYATVLSCHPVAVSGTGSATGTVSIYPNPASQQFSVAYDGVVNEPMTVTMYDMMGKQVYAQRTASNVMPVQVSSFAPGLYYCQVIANGQKTMRRVTIQ